MSSPVRQDIVLLTDADMALNVATARVDADNFQSGCITAAWSGNNALDATLFVQVSADGTRWSNISLVLDDVGSVTIDTADDYQDFAFTFQQNFPVPYIRLTYSRGSNTAGLLNVVFRGYRKAPGI